MGKVILFIATAAALGGFLGTCFGHLVLTILEVLLP